MAPPRRRVVPGARSAEPAGDVVLGEAVARIGEYAIGVTDLDELAEVEVRGALRHARRLILKCSGSIA